MKNLDHVKHIVFVTKTSIQSELYNLLGSDVTPECLIPFRMPDGIWRLKFPMFTPNHQTFIVNADEDEAINLEPGILVLINCRNKEKFTGIVKDDDDYIVI